jgi:hypothetical protein
MLCGCAAFILEGWIGGYRLDSQVVEKSLEAAIELGVNAGEDTVKIRHGVQILALRKIATAIRGAPTLKKNFP